MHCFNVSINSLETKINNFFSFTPSLSDAYCILYTTNTNIVHKFYM